MSQHQHQDEFVTSDLFAEEESLERYALEWEVRKGRNMLFWIGGLIMAGDFIGMSMDGLEKHNMAFVLGFDLVLTLIFVGLGLFAMKKPVAAFTIALTFYIVLALFMMANFRPDAYGNWRFTLDIQFNLGVLVIKGLIVYLLVKGLRAARRLREFESRRS